MGCHCGTLIDLGEDCSLIVKQAHEEEEINTSY